MVRVKFNPGRKVKRIQKKLEDPRVILTQIGVLMVAESQAGFKRQMFGGVRWKERAVPNVFGILQDLSQGSKIPSRRMEPRPALRDTGALAKSIAFKVYGKSSVAVGSALKYADVHNRGGKVTSPKITQPMQIALWKWLKRKPKEIRAKLGWLVSPNALGKKLTGTVSKRQFIGLTRSTKAAVKRLLGVTVMEVRK